MLIHNTAGTKCCRRLLGASQIKIQQQEDTEAAAERASWEEEAARQAAVARSKLEANQARAAKRRQHQQQQQQRQSKAGSGSSSSSSSDGDDQHDGDNLRSSDWWKQQWQVGPRMTTSIVHASCITSVWTMSAHKRQLAHPQTSYVYGLVV